MAAHNCTSMDGLLDLQILIVELEKEHPNPKIIKTLTTKYGIPYKLKVSEQLDELLTYLNGLPLSSELELNEEI